jgi:hypothetical protein
MRRSNLYFAAEGSGISVEKKSFLVVIASCVLPLLIASVFGSLASAQMMPTGMPTVQPTAQPSDNSMVILTIVTAIVAVAVVAIVMYLVIIRRREKKARSAKPEHVYTSRGTVSTLSQSGITPQQPKKPYEVFLCYKKSSGKDYADQLKSGLEEVGLHTFEDCKDIPQTVTTEEGWDRVRDQALEESKYFVLIMTPGFDLSSEVVKEIAIARRQANKTFIFFRHRSMGRKIVVDLGNEVLDIGRLEQVSFESKEELLRLAINILKSGSPKATASL